MSFWLNLCSALQFLVIVWLGYRKGMTLHLYPVFGARKNLRKREKREKFSCIISTVCLKPLSLLISYFQPFSLSCFQFVFCFFPLKYGCFALKSYVEFNSRSLFPFFSVLFIYSCSCGSQRSILMLILLEFLNLEPKPNVGLFMLYAIFTEIKDSQPEYSVIFSNVSGNSPSENFL